MKGKQEKKKFKSSYGAVTVFLTIILLPCMIFVCAFGDVSRVMLSKSQAEAASDLALYSLMSNYDEDLKEWYGMVASVQSVDKFYDVTEEYFKGMLTSSGMDGGETELALGYFSDMIDALKGDGSITDFLQVSFGNPETKVKGVTDGTLGVNPALVEDSIVEFMKYRGPVELVTKLINRFKSLNLASDLGDADKDEPITKAKQKYAEAEGEMMEELLYTYLALLQYMKYFHAHPELKLDNFSKYEQDLNKIRTDFGEVTRLITQYYAATSGIKDLTAEQNKYGYFFNYALPTTNNFNNDVTKIRCEFNNHTYTMSDIGATEKTDDSGNKYYTITPDKLATLLNSIDDKISQVKTAANNIYNQMSGIASPSSNSDVNPAIYCMQVQNTVKTSDINTIKNNGEDLLQIYAKLLLAEWCEVDTSFNLGSLFLGGDYDENTDWAKEIDNAKKKIESCHANYFSYSDGSSSYEKQVKAYHATASVTVPKVTSRGYTFDSTYCGKKVTIKEFLQSVQNVFGSLVDVLDQQIKYVDTIIKGGPVSYNSKNYTAVSLDSLKKKIEEYTTSREKWHQSALNGSSTYADEEVEEYNEQEAARGKYGADSNVIASLGGDGPAQCDQLKTRMTNIKNDLVALRDALKNFKYGGYSVATLTQDQAIAGATASVVPKTVNGIGTSLSAAAEKAKTYNSQLISPASGAIYTAPTLKSGKTGNNPDLDVDMPDLYEYLKNAIKEEDLNDAIDKKDEADKDKEACKTAAEDAKNDAAKVDEGLLAGKGEDPGEGRGGEPYGAAAAIKGLYGVVKTLIDGNFDELRDRLYVVEYCMDMFTYSTTNNEGYVRFSSGADPTSTLNDYNNNTKAFSSDAKDSWNTVDATSLYQNQSLTNRPLNKSYNYSNLGEVEYILYGESTLNGNLSKVYGNIYALKLIINLISGLQFFYTPKDVTGDIIEAIADFIAGVTMGLVPMPLTKIIIITVMTALETAHDLKRLKAGLPVALYKSKADQWWCKLPGYQELESIGSFLEQIKGGGYPEPVDENGLYYSEYLYLFMLIAAQDSDVYTGMLKRITDLVEHNMRLQLKQDVKNGKYTLNESRVYFQLKSTIEVKPLLLNLWIVDSMDGVDASTVRESTGWRTYTIDMIRGYS